MDHDTRADSQSRYKSTLAFTDLLFNVLIGFAFLFIIAFILINPITEEAHIKAKAEFMVIMEWDDKSNYDIDLWMQDPLDTIVGFPNKESGWLHLDKDDLGKIFILRKILAPMGTTEAMEFLLDKMLSTKTNADFFQSMGTK